MSTQVDPTAPSGAHAEPLPSVWQAVKDSLRGKRADYTELPLKRAILLLAVPMALELVMESTFGLVDIFFVGRLGPQAIATVGISGSLIIVIFAVAMGLSIGTTAMVSRRIGEGDDSGANVAATQAIFCGIAFSIPLGIGGWMLAPAMLRWMGGSADVVAGAEYTAVIFGGCATIFLLFLNNAIFRGAGDAAMAMRSLWLANILNMILDPILIFGLGPIPAMGLLGAGIATVIGRGVGVLFQFWVLAFGDRRVQVKTDALRIDVAVARRLLRLSISGMLQFFVATASWLGIMRIVALFGDATLAGYTIAMRLIHFTILPSWGMSNAAATLVGQNLGAKKPDRAEKAVWLTGRYNFFLLASEAAIYWIFAEPMIRVFTVEPLVIEAGVLSLRISSAAYLFSAFTMVFSQAFNGAGDTDTPTKINVVCFWLLQLPLAYYLARVVGWGLAGALSAIVISLAAWALIGLIVFKKGGWKKVQV